MNRLHGRRLTLWCLCIWMVILACGASAAPETSAWDAAYQISSRTLRLEGALESDSFLLIRIVPFQNAKTILQEGAAAESALDIVKTVERGSDNSISAGISLPESYTGARYIYRANAGEDTKSGYLLCVDSQAIAQGLEQVNSAQSGEMEEALEGFDPQSGLDNGDGEKDASYLAQLVQDFRPAGGYTQETFLNSYMQAEAMAYVKQETYTLEEALEFYRVYLDRDYSADYESLGEAQRGSMEGLYREGPLGSSFQEVFQDSAFLAQVWNADSSVALKEILLEYFEAQDVSLADYNRIDNAYRQDSVFSGLYAGRQSYKTPEEVIAAFDGAVEEILTGEGGGSTGGSGPSTGGGGSSSSGGGRGTSSGTGTVRYETDTTQGAAGVPWEFSDMENHWAKEAVEAMAQRQIISGMGDGTFHPDEPVTRAEFAKMLAALLQLPQGAESTFSDVDPESWYAPYVAAAAQAGIVVGSDGRFFPEEKVTRQDAALMVDRTLALRQDEAGQEITYLDQAEIAPYALEAVQRLSSSEILQGSDGAFHPQENMTRAEAAVMLWRAAQWIS